MAAAILLREQQRARQPVPATRIALYLVLAEDQTQSMLHATSANAPLPTPHQPTTKHSAQRIYRTQRLPMVRFTLTQSYGQAMAIQLEQFLVMVFHQTLYGLKTVHLLGGSTFFTIKFVAQVHPQSSNH